MKCLSVCLSGRKHKTVLCSQCVPKTVLPWEVSHAAHFKSLPMLQSLLCNCHGFLLFLPINNKRPSVTKHWNHVSLSRPRLCKHTQTHKNVIHFFLPHNLLHFLLFPHFQLQTGIIAKFLSRRVVVWVCVKAEILLAFSHNTDCCYYLKLFLRMTEGEGRKHGGEEGEGISASLLYDMLIEPEWQFRMQLSVSLTDTLWWLISFWQSPLLVGAVWYHCIVFLLGTSAGD